MSALDFSVLRYTPDPEDVEPVNVALVLWQDPPELLIDPKFPRLACLAEYADPDVVRFYLDDFGRRLGRPEHGARALSSQFQVGDRKRIVAPLTEATLEMLRNKYLRKHRPALARFETIRAGHEQRVESVLDQLLVTRLHIPDGFVLRRASPKEFLSPQVFDRMGGNGFKVARAIRGPHDLLLVDGVNVGQRNFEQAQVRAQNIAAGYFKLNRVRDDLLRLEGRRMQTATILFGHAPPKRATKQEFLVTMLKTFSDHLMEDATPSPAFRQVVREIAGPLSAPE